MSQSVLLTIARKSIEEVLQAEQSIDRTKLIEEYPILKEAMGTQITLYLNDKVRGSSQSNAAVRPLLDDIIHNAKVAAFQDANHTPLTTSEYLHTSVELVIFSPEGPLSHKDDPILKET
jgi:AMMECR1 domain-containing protein